MTVPPPDRPAPWADVCRVLGRFGLGVAGLIAFSVPASAHGAGHSVGPTGAGTAFAVVLGLPVLAGLVGGLAAIRYHSLRRMETINTDASLAVGLLLVGLGGASLIPAVTGHPWLSVVGGVTGAAIAMGLAGERVIPVMGCGTHTNLTLGAISTHRVLEGVVVGTLYSAGAAVGLGGAVVLAGHGTLETAAVGGLYATTQRRIRALGAVALVQAGYVVGGIAGLGVAGAVPVSVRTLVLAVVGGALLIVGARETERSITTDGSALIS